MTQYVYAHRAATAPAAVPDPSQGALAGVPAFGTESGAYASTSRPLPLPHALHALIGQRPRVIQEVYSLLPRRPPSPNSAPIPAGKAASWRSRWSCTPGKKTSGGMCMCTPWSPAGH